MCLFHFGTEDERPCAAHFQVKIILEDLALPSCSPNKRRIICYFPIIVHRCLERVEAQFNLQQTPLKSQKLKEQWHTLDPLLREVCLNRIDKLATDILTNAAKVVDS